MNRIVFVTFLLIAFAGEAFAGRTAGTKAAPVILTWSQIAFDDLAPQGFELRQCWNGLGMDGSGRIYIGFTSDRDDGREDFAVFRYDPASGERLFLGTFIDIAAAVDNLQAGEHLPKGHTRMILADGKMYMGSQGFHDFKKDIGELTNYRGSHLFSFDTSSGLWEDLAAALPGGVVTEHQGIVALSILREEHVLVGLTHPHSDIVLFDYRENRVVALVPGIPWKLGNPLSREIIVAPSGKIYTYRGSEDPRHRIDVNPVWVYDMVTENFKDTGFSMTNGFWVGQAETRDRSKIYVSTVNGQLYEFDTATETFKDLGYMLPKSDYDAGRRISFQYGVTLAPDEKKIYFIPSVLKHPSGSGELYAYDIATGEVTFVQQLLPGIYTSGDLRDGKNIYFAHFGDSQDLWSGKVRLMIIGVPSD